MTKKTRIILIVLLISLSAAGIIFHSCGCQFSTNYAHEHIKNKEKGPINSGPKIWIGTQLLGTSAGESGKGVSIDSNNNIYITGFTSGNLDGKTNAEGYDIFLVKYNSSGEKQWTQQLSASADEVANGVSIDSNNNIYITGYTYGNLDGKTNAGGYDIFLVKYNSSGEKQWTQLLGSSSYDKSYGVSTDSNNNIYITGSTSGNLDGKTNAGQRDIFLVKYNSSGEKQWTQQLGSSTGEYGKGVSIDSNNNIYIAGGTSGNLDGKTNAGDYDIFLVKYNSSGEKQ